MSPLEPFWEALKSTCYLLALVCSASTGYIPISFLLSFFLPFCLTVSVSCSCSLPLVFMVFFNLFHSRPHAVSLSFFSSSSSCSYSRLQALVVAINSRNAIVVFLDLNICFIEIEVLSISFLPVVCIPMYLYHSQFWFYFILILFLLALLVMTSPNDFWITCFCYIFDYFYKKFLFPKSPRHSLWNSYH